MFERGDTVDEVLQAITYKITEPSKEGVIKVGAKAYGANELPRKSTVVPEDLENPQIQIILNHKLTVVKKPIETVPMTYLIEQVSKKMHGTNTQQDAMRMERAMKLIKSATGWTDAFNALREYANSAGVDITEDIYEIARQQKIPTEETKSVPSPPPSPKRADAPTIPPANQTSTNDHVPNRWETLSQPRTAVERRGNNPVTELAKTGTNDAECAIREQQNKERQALTTPTSDAKAIRATKGSPVITIGYSTPCTDRGFFGLAVSSPLISTSAPIKLRERGQRKGTNTKCMKVGSLKYQQLCRFEGNLGFFLSQDFSAFLSCGAAMIKGKVTVCGDKKKGTDSFSMKCTRIAPVIGVGMAYAVAPRVTLTLQARHTFAVKLRKKGAPHHFSAKQTSIEAGVAYHF
jgi:hypothetical protein